MSIEGFNNLPITQYNIKFYENYNEYNRQFLNTNHFETLFIECLKRHIEGDYLLEFLYTNKLQELYKTFNTINDLKNFIQKKIKEGNGYFYTNKLIETYIYELSKIFFSNNELFDFDLYEHITKEEINKIIDETIILILEKTKSELKDFFRYFGVDVEKILNKDENLINNIKYNIESTLSRFVMKPNDELYDLFKDITGKKYYPKIFHH